MPGKHRGNLSGRMPHHKPDKRLWGRIESGMEGIPGPVWPDNLPQHKAEPGLWNAIGKQLPAPWYSWKNPYSRGAVVVILLLTTSILFVGREKENPTETTLENSQIQNQLDNNAVHKMFENEYVLQKDISEGHNYPQQRSPQIAASAPANKSETLRSGETSVFGPKAISSGTTLMKTNKNEEKTIQQDKMNSEANFVTQLPSRMPKLAVSSNNDKHRKPMKKGSHGSSAVLSNKTSFEVGLHLQPGYIKNISSNNDSWYPTSSIGLSLAFRKNRLLMETGIKYSQVEYDDQLQIDYFEYQFLGTVISTERYTIENYIDENGQPQTRKNYIVELIDLYDSTLQEEKQIGHVKMAGVELPLSIGYRLAGGGRFYADIKTGFDLMVITQVSISHESPGGEITRLLDVQNNLPDKYNVKWKYHLAMGFGYRMGEKLFLLLQPTARWHLEGMSTRGTGEYKKPFEVGLQFGLRWEL